MWAEILDENALISHLDADSVKHLELLCPAQSAADRRRVAVLVDENLILPSISNVWLRMRLKQRVLRIHCRIPSLFTFFEDTKFLEPSSKILQIVFPPTRRLEQLEQACSQAYRGSWFRFDYRRIFLFAMRYFPDLIAETPRTDSKKPKPKILEPSEVLWKLLAEEVIGCNFWTPPVNELRTRDVTLACVRDLFKRLVPHRDQNQDEAHLVDAVYQIVTDMPRYSEAARGDPELSLNLFERPMDHRCGRPFESDYNYYRDYFRSSNVDRAYSDGSKDYISPFGIAREIFLAFFGRLPFGGDDSEPEDPLPQPPRLRENRNARSDINEQSQGIGEVHGDDPNPNVPGHGHSTEEVHQNHPPEDTSGLSLPETQSQQVSDQDQGAQGETRLSFRGQGRPSSQPPAQTDNRRTLWPSDDAGSSDTIRALNLIQTASTSYNRRTSGSNLDSSATIFPDPISRIFGSQNQMHSARGAVSVSSNRLTSAGDVDSNATVFPDPLGAATSRTLNPGTSASYRSPGTNFPDALGTNDSSEPTRVAGQPVSSSRATALQVRGDSDAGSVATVFPDPLGAHVSAHSENGTPRSSKRPFNNGSEGRDRPSKLRRLDDEAASNRLWHLLACLRDSQAPYLFDCKRERLFTFCLSLRDLHDSINRWRQDGQTLWIIDEQGSWRFTHDPFQMLTHGNGFIFTKPHLSETGTRREPSWWDEILPNFDDATITSPQPTDRMHDLRIRFTSSILTQARLTPPEAQQPRNLVNGAELISGPVSEILQ